MKPEEIAKMKAKIPYWKEKRKEARKKELDYIFKGKRSSADRWHRKAHEYDLLIDAWERQ